MNKRQLKAHDGTGAGTCAVADAANQRAGTGVGAGPHALGSAGGSASVSVFQASAISYATFMLGSCREVDDLTGKANALGGRVIKAPYPTYYGQWQAVLADPANNMFRLSFQGLPEGMKVPQLAL